jgi:hypothetical protein
MSTVSTLKESGQMVELLARRIHGVAPSARAVVVAVIDCQQITIDSDTGARTAKARLVEFDLLRDTASVQAALRAMNPTRSETDEAIRAYDRGSWEWDEDNCCLVPVSRPPEGTLFDTTDDLDEPDPEGPLMIEAGPDDDDLIEAEIIDPDPDLDDDADSPADAWSDLGGSDA